MGNLMIDITGLSEYVPYEGLGRSDLLTKDGIFILAIAKAQASIAKESKREMITLAMNVTDDPEKQDDGKSIIHNVVIGGVDKNNKPMVRQLGDLLLAMGYTVEQIKNFASRKSIDLEALCKETLANPAKPARVFAQIAAEAFTADDGSVQVSSKVQNFVAKAKYDEAVAVRAHRKAHKYGDGSNVPASAASNSASGGLGAPAGGGGLGAPAGSATPASASKPASGDLAGL